MAEYARAETLHRRLDAKPAAIRTRYDYERSLDAYRAVYHSDPASPDAARSVAAVADLLTSEGRDFHNSRLLHDAVAQWKFLCSQYPGSPLRRLARLQEAEIEQHDLRNNGGAQKTPHTFPAQPDKRPPEPTEAQRRIEPNSYSPLSAVLRTKTADQISVIQQPPRTAKISHPIVAEPGQKIPAAATVQYWTLDNSPPEKTATIQGVRYWTQGKSTRIAIDLSGAVPYRAYPAADNRQITLIFFGAHPAESLRETIAIQHDANVRSAQIISLTGSQTELVLQLLRPLKFSSFILSNPQRIILDIGGHENGNFQPAVASLPVKALARSAPPSFLPENKGVLPGPHTAAVFIPDGQRSMTRVLGLRVRRIVIDAGHGGHDSGTLGPGGLEEKTVALDVALRLGRLLQQRMGADVIYTRRTDTFVPLEQRTALANRAHADLFLSIHANSSADPDARGVETYFLNFTASPAALAVAARENAVSNRSVYELSDLVRRITLSDKIDESRAFAGDVQQSLYSGLAAGNAGLKDRGVKQAPFVVLIGAHMPSILAEISFLTNPTDASELSEPAYRARLAEALYRGVVDYVDGMSGVHVAKTAQPKMITGTAE